MKINHSDFIPQERSTQFKSILNTIKNFVTNNTQIQHPVHIYGVPGTGKTYTIKCVMEYLKNIESNLKNEVKEKRVRKTKKININTDINTESNTIADDVDFMNKFSNELSLCLKSKNINYCYINCVKHSNKKSSLMEIIEKQKILQKNMNVEDIFNPKRGRKKNVITPSNVNINQIKSEKMKKICLKKPENLNKNSDKNNNSENYNILFLDEFDTITSNKQITYSILDLPYSSNSLIFVITNNFTIKTKETKIISRLGNITLKFQPYNHLQLENLLLNNKKITKQSIKIISRYMAMFGDMRRVNNILNNVGNMDNANIIKVLKEAQLPLMVKFKDSFMELEMDCIKEISKMDTDKDLGNEELYNRLKGIWRLKGLEVDFYEFLKLKGRLEEAGVFRNYFDSYDIF